MLEHISKQCKLQLVDFLHRQLEFALCLPDWQVEILGKMLPGNSNNRSTGGYESFGGFKLEQWLG